LWAVFTDALSTILLRDARFAAAIIMGRGVSPPPVPVRVLTNRPHRVGVVECIQRSYSLVSAHNQKEFNMYIGGGVLLLLLLLFLVFRWPLPTG
jgi:hypothetical protein